MDTGGSVISDVIETNVAGIRYSTNTYSMPMLKGHPYPIEVPLYKAVGDKYYTFVRVAPLQTGTNESNKIDYKFDGTSGNIRFIYQIVGYYKWYGEVNTDFGNCYNWLVYDLNGGYSKPSLGSCGIQRINGTFTDFPRKNAPFVIDSTFEPETLKGSTYVIDPGSHNCDPACVAQPEADPPVTCTQCQNSHYNYWLANYSPDLSGALYFPDNKLIIRPNAGEITSGVPRRGDTWTGSTESTAKPGLTWASGGNTDLTLASVQVEGTLQKAPTSSTLTSLGAFIVSGSGSANLTNITLNLKGDLELQNNSTFLAPTSPGHLQR